MNDPLTATAVTAAATGTIIAAPLFGIDPSIVIGAVCGAGIFVMHESTKNLWERLFLFVASVAIGFIAAESFTCLVNLILPASIEINLGVGAVVASAVSVRVTEKVIKLVEISDLDKIIRGIKK